MSEQQNGNPPKQGGKEQAAPGETIFDQPAPAGAAKKTSEVLGEIVWLMSQSPLHKQFFVSDLEWFVMTPMLLQQFRLFHDKDKPIGVVFWATVNEEVETRLAAGATACVHAEAHAAASALEFTQSTNAPKAWR